jgi:predicted ester cyclase
MEALVQDGLLQSNKAVLRRHFDEVLNRGKLEVVDEIYDVGYVLDAPVQTDGSARAHGRTLGRDGLKRRVNLFRTGFPDIHFTVDLMLADGDKVVVQYTFEGTHLGQFLEIEPTGNTISLTGILIARVSEGRVQGAFSVFDSGQMMQQLNPR